MDSGYTITPVPTEDAAGNVSYHFDVDEHNNKQEVIEDFNSNDMLFEANDGTVHHKLEHLDLSQAQLEEPDYVPEPTQLDYQGVYSMTAEDASDLRNLCGGDAEYAAMLNYAANNFPEHIVDGFNQLIAAGDIENLQDIIPKMWNYYQQDSDAVQSPRRSQPSQQPENDFSHIAESEQYQDMILRASQILTNEEIHKYDTVMNSGDRQLMSKAIKWLNNKVYG